MSEFILSNQRAIDFFSKHTHLDFNTQRYVVDILEKLMDSLSDKIDNSQNTLLIQELATHQHNRILCIKTTNNHARNARRCILDFFTTSTTSNRIFANQIDSLISSMREIVKSNNNDSEKNIIRELTRDNELFQ